MNLNLKHTGTYTPDFFVSFFLPQKLYHELFLLQTFIYPTCDSIAIEVFVTTSEVTLHSENESAAQVFGRLS